MNIDIDSASQWELEELFRTIFSRLPASFITSDVTFAAPFIEAGLFTRKSYENFRRRGKKSAQSSLPKALINIAKNLPSLFPSVSIDSLWEPKNSYLAHHSPQDDPIQRHRYLKEAEEEVDKDTNLSHDRRRVLQVLQGNEREIVKNIGGSKPTTRAGRERKPKKLTKKDIAMALNIDFKTLVRWGTQFRRYTSMAERFGPGSLRHLGNYPSAHTE
jgi:hypothetical protein